MVMEALGKGLLRRNQRHIILLIINFEAFMIEYLKLINPSDYSVVLYDSGLEAHILIDS